MRPASGAAPGSATLLPELPPALLEARRVAILEESAILGRDVSRRFFRELGPFTTHRNRDGTEPVKPAADLHVECRKGVWIVRDAAEVSVELVLFLGDESRA